MLSISTMRKKQSSNKRFIEIGRAALLILILMQTALASDAVTGDSHRYQSPNGLEERCIALNPIPYGEYSFEDKQLEAEYCSIDIYSKNTAICPKLSSTSPATFIYDLSGGKFEGNQAEFEKSVCPRGDVIVKEAHGAPTDFKVTMNAQNASATFSTASLLYYHFSRYFRSYVHVPVSVFRTIDRVSHEQRITSRGLQWSAQRKSLKMNHAAWQELDAVEKKPLLYPEPDEIFTSDLKQIYGILMRIKGKRYGEEVNGTRKSGWGKGQSFDFQQTPPFLALRSAKNLFEAIAGGVAKGHSPQQMVYWMQELTEITLLDFIFSQQDRVGNIDFLSYWYEQKDGKIFRKRAMGKHEPARPNALLIKRTLLNDNDAAGKRAYANYTKSTGMLEGIRHYNPKTYQRLQYLARDIDQKGPLYDYLKTTFGLTEVQFQQAITNIKQAAAILYGNCKSGKLTFDLDPDNHFLTGKPDLKPTKCEPMKELTS